MEPNTTQKRLMQRIINVFETGSPDGDYSTIAIFKDGPHNIRQITYGRSQTTEYGNLQRLVEDYVNAGGLFSQQLEPFVDRIGSDPLTDDAEFKKLLRKAGKEDPVMRETQDQFFDDVYYRPAIQWAKDHGFTLPLSGLVIYDSFIHSGSILRVIRKKFPETPPSSGGDEKAWTKAYVKARHNWLKNHSRPIVRSTIYRTACFDREIERSNWDLSIVPVKANGTNVGNGDA
jgi:chitosanase